MQCETLQDFLAKAKEFFLEDPYETLFKMKYTPGKQLVTFHVRLGNKHAEYKTESVDEAKRADVINSAFIRLSASPKVDAETIDKLLAPEPESEEKDKKPAAAHQKNKKV